METVVAQNGGISISGKVAESEGGEGIPFATIILKTKADTTFIKGTISNEEGLFVLTELNAGTYFLELSSLGFQTKYVAILIGQMSAYQNAGNIFLTRMTEQLDEIVVNAQRDEVNAGLNKKTYSIEDNLSQSGGSVLQAVSNLPGVTISQEGKMQLRGSERIMVLIDGQQSALTGYDGQKGLDNIPASAIDRIEVINNPSSRYESNGNAGIINIILKKSGREGLHGSVGLSLGVGALWEKRENLPAVGMQFRDTPKFNPSFSMNYKKNNTNLFLQADYLYQQTLNKNEFSTRNYEDGTTILQQIRRNRTTGLPTAKVGIDHGFSPNDLLTISGFYSQEIIDDRGYNPYFLNDLNNRFRLWQFIEDEVKYTAAANASYTHKFPQAGHTIGLIYNYSFHREDEKYFFTNSQANFSGTDAFALISDESIHDFGLDYQKPVRQGHLEAGLKMRFRTIPVNMQFMPGLNSQIDANAGGWADYYENIPAAYTNYIYEQADFDVEAGLRVEYVWVDYKVNPDHNTYKSDGYRYFQPFPSLRFTYKMGPSNRLSVFYNRRVDRPNEVDIRIFPKYDEPELIKVGNPSLKPQFTNTIEAGFKHLMENGNFYAAAYHKMIDGTIVRIATRVDDSRLLYNVFQNAGKSTNTGLEVVWQWDAVKILSINSNINVYRNIIQPFSVINLYPSPSPFNSAKQSFTSGNIKVNFKAKFSKNFESQLTAIYLAKDILPQGSIGPRFSVDGGLKWSIQKGKGALLLNATDLFNTLKIQTYINGNDFTMESTNYLETQVIRMGYQFKF